MGLGTLCIDTVAISSCARPLRRAGQQPTTICGAAAINAPCCSTAAVSDKPSDASWLAIYRRSRRRGCSTRRRFQRKHSTQVFARVGRRGDATAQLQRSEANSPSTEKLYDVVAISNLCVDVVVPVEGSEQLPIGVSGSEKRALLERLTTKCCDRDAWEVGGNSNFLIAASRLGLRAASIGHVGNDGAGRFLRDVFEREGIQGVKGVVPDGHPLLSKTLLCFVLVAPNADHAFCSTYDLGPWPLLKGVDVLSPETREMLRRTRALFLNGYVLDELPGSLVMLMVKEAMSHGAAIFFDPGPRSHSLMMGENRAFLDEILDCADAVLMTEEEAEMVTGCAGAEAAAERMLGRQGGSGHWIVVKRGADGALLAVQGHRPVQLPGIKVQVQDTVGCGDSFAAAMVLGYIRGHPPLTALALANAVGAATATGRGAGRNVASAEQVRALLLSQSAAPAAAASDGGSSAASHAALELLEQSLAAAPRTLV